MSCRRCSFSAPALRVAFMLIYSIILTPTICTDAVPQNDCTVVICPKQADCPADSAVVAHAWLEETFNQVDDESDDQDQATMNPFVGVSVETLGHVPYSTAAPPQILATVSTNAVIASVSDSETDRFTTTNSRRRRRQLQLEQTPGLLDLLSEQQLSYAQRQCCQHTWCSCNKCSLVPKCPVDGEVAIELRLGRGVPGYCCSQYVCSTQPSCEKRNDTAVVAYWRDSCSRCLCIGNDELCLNHCQTPEENKLEIPSGCYSEYLNEMKMEGSSWLEDDFCTECWCTQGKPECTANVCAAVECSQPLTKIEGKCCPQCPLQENRPNSTELHSTTPPTVSGVITTDISTSSSTLAAWTESNELNSTNATSESTPAALSDQTTHEPMEAIVTDGLTPTSTAATITLSSNSDAVLAGVSLSDPLEISYKYNDRETVDASSSSEQSSLYPITEAPTVSPSYTTNTPAVISDSSTSSPSTLGSVVDDNSDQRNTTPTTDNPSTGSESTGGYTTPWSSPSIPLITQISASTVVPSLLEAPLPTSFRQPHHSFGTLQSPIFWICVGIIFCIAVICFGFFCIRAHRQCSSKTSKHRGPIRTKMYASIPSVESSTNRSSTNSDYTV